MNVVRIQIIQRKIALYVHFEGFRRTLRNDRLKVFVSSISEVFHLYSERCFEVFVIILKVVMQKKKTSDASWLPNMDPKGRLESEHVNQLRYHFGSFLYSCIKYSTYFGLYSVKTSCSFESFFILQASSSKRAASRTNDTVFTHPRSVWFEAHASVCMNID